MINPVILDSRRAPDRMTHRERITDFINAVIANKQRARRDTQARVRITLHCAGINLTIGA